MDGDLNRGPNSNPYIGFVSCGRTTNTDCSLHDAQVSLVHALSCYRLLLIGALPAILSFRHLFRFPATLVERHKCLFGVGTVWYGRDPVVSALLVG